MQPRQKMGLLKEDAITCSLHTNDVGIPKARNGREAAQVTWLWEIPEGAESALLNGFGFYFHFCVRFVVVLCFFKQHKWDEYSLKRWNKTIRAQACRRRQEEEKK